MDNVHVMYLDFCRDILYAKALLDSSDDVIKEPCSGCHIKHPSQTGHSCLMLKRKELMFLYFDLILAKVDDNAIILDWDEEVSKSSVSPELVVQYKEQVLFEHFKTEKWKKYTLKMVNRLSKLESRFIFA